MFILTPTFDMINLETVTRLSLVTKTQNNKPVRKIIAYEPTLPQGICIFSAPEENGKTDNVWEELSHLVRKDRRLCEITESGEVCDFEPIPR